MSSGSYDLDKLFTSLYIKHQTLAGRDKLTEDDVYELCKDFAIAFLFDTELQEKLLRESVC